MANKRSILLPLSLALLLIGCSGSEMSLTEYVERVNATVNRAS